MARSNILKVPEFLGGAFFLMAEKQNGHQIKSDIVIWSNKNHNSSAYFCVMIDF